MDALKIKELFWLPVVDAIRTLAVPPPILELVGGSSKM
jgi:hypothetical protein